MAPSLYDDLDDLVKKPTGPSSSKPAPNVGLRVTGNWSDEKSNKAFNSNLKMMQAQIAARKAQMTRNAPSNPSPSILPSSSVLTNSSSAEGSFRFNQRTGKMERITVANIQSTSIIGGVFGELSIPFVGISDEYNPLTPNDYEKLVSIRREQRLKEQSSDKTFATPKWPSKDRNSAGNSSSSESDQEEEENEKRRRMAARGSLVAPPPSLLESSISSASDIPSDSSIIPEVKNFSGINQVAAKMMAKMGYREGQGLGRESQGMSTALVVEKTGRSSGKIIHERDRPRPGQVEILACTPLVAVDDDDGEQDFDGTSISVIPPPDKVSNVILLRNMVCPGEVDHDLEPETAEECSKYGPVRSCLIFEIPDAPEEEAVRIFIEFADNESAIRAVLDLNGRYFGGRVVKANFYDQHKFTNLEFSETPIS